MCNDVEGSCNNKLYISMKFIPSKWKVFNKYKIWTQSFVSHYKVHNYIAQLMELRDRGNTCTLYWPQSWEIVGLVASVCPFVCALLAEPFDLWPWYLICWSTLTLARVGLQVKVVGPRPSSSAKIGLLTSLLPWFKVKCQGQGHGSMSKVKVKFLECSGRY